jgi:two-component system sensor histidine kinase RegB
MRHSAAALVSKGGVVNCAILFSGTRGGAAAMSAGVELLEVDERWRVNLSLLVRLHWWAIVGQIGLIATTRLLANNPFPVLTLGALVAAETIGNVLVERWTAQGRVALAHLVGIMAIDAAVLAVLIDLTGGAFNPFSTLFLVNIALAAALLPGTWAWVLSGLNLACYGALFVHEWITSPHHHIDVSPSQDFMRLHGMWVAFCFAAAFIVYFIRRVARALADRERELQVVRIRVDRRERLASLATLAAGAAHELSTPLSTIAVVSQELKRTLADAPEEVRQDLSLIREQVARCREILDRMARHAGEHAGEPFASLALPAWAESGLDGLSDKGRVTLEIAPGAEHATVIGPPRALGDALRGLLKNALQASPPGVNVRLWMGADDGRIRVAVIDQGRGMPPDVLQRAGEPFFTTKVPGEGMGLGLFLTRTLVDQLGGEFTMASRPGVGTEVRIELPAVQAGERSSK